MLIRKYASLAIAMVVLASPSVYSAETAGALKQLYINDQGTVLFTLTSATSGGSPTCDRTDDSWQFKVEPSNQFFKEFYSTLLTAHAAGQSIIVGHGTDCGGGYPAVITKYLYFK